MVIFNFFKSPNAKPLTFPSRAAAPNAQPSLPYDDDVNEEGLYAAGDEADKISAGDLLRFLKNIASDRGLSSHTKSFRYGISKRK